MKVIISGMAGVGKSTLAKAIARRYNLKLFSGGDMLKEIARGYCHNSMEDFWWETRRGLDFLTRRISDERFDKELDRKITAILNEGNVVVTAMTVSWHACMRGDSRSETMDIYYHIDRKELRDSYLAHIPPLGI